MKHQPQEKSEWGNTIKKAMPL